MSPISKPDSSRAPAESRTIGIDPDSNPDGGAVGGPVGAMHAELSARLSTDQYEQWLLPPEPRDSVESAVHWLSLGAGVLALTGAATILWLIF